MFCHKLCLTQNECKYTWKPLLITTMVSNILLIHLSDDIKQLLSVKNYQPDRFCVLIVTQKNGDIISYKAY